MFSKQSKKVLQKLGVVCLTATLTLTSYSELGNMTVNAKDLEYGIGTYAGLNAEIYKQFSEIKKNQNTIGNVREQLKNLDDNTDVCLSVEPNEDIVIIKASYDDILESIEDVTPETEIATEELEEDLDDLVTVNTDVEELSKTVYATKSIKVRNLPTKESDIVDTYSKGTEIEVTGKVGKWYRIKYKEGDAFVVVSSTSTEPIITDTQVDVIEKEVVEKEEKSTYTWKGGKLTQRKGVNYGPSGKETFYNMNMSYIVKRLKQKGYKGDYWVRSDGCKMFGDYIMVAADFNIRPIGTILPTSLGMAIVADTGGFAKRNHTQLDIATNWGRLEH